MAIDIQSIFEKKIKPLYFERRIGLFGATTIGVGALLGAGVYVLIGEAADKAGPSVILSYLLCGALAFVTTLMYAELSRIIPRSGGGYAYAYDLLGGVGGFTTGWFLALGSIFASGLYAIGFAEYAVSLTRMILPEYVIRLIAICITLIIVFINIRRPDKNKKINSQNWIIWGNVAILLLLIFFSFFHLKSVNLEPVFPKGFHGTLGAISVIYISFFGYQLIANNADEIVNPEKTIPRAMKLSMLISIGLYLLVTATAVMVVPWEELSKSRAPLVLLANKSFGGKGWIIISLGGILASFGALSSTLVSQSRQTYVMGKDRFFPDIMGKLNEKSRQPTFALITGALLICLILIFFDLDTIAKVTNFSLLLSLLPVSLAMRKFFLENPTLKPKAKWKQVLPEVSLLINLGLLLTIDIFSLALGQQLALAGVLIYFFYSRKRVKRGKEGLNILLKDESQFSFFNKNKILVPMSNPETQEALLMLSNTLLAKTGGEIIVLAIKDAPPGTDFYEALADAGETLEVIKRSIEHAESNNIQIQPIIRASRKISLGIAHVAQEENTDLIIMGFPKKNRDDKPEIFQEVLKTASTDILFLNLKTSPEKFTPKRIGVYVKNTTHLNMMLICAAAIAEQHKSKIVFIGFLPTDYSKNQKSKIDRLFVEGLQNLNSSALYEVSLNLSDDPIKELIRISAGFDLLITGNDHHHLLGKTIDESGSYRIASQAECSVILVKSITRLRKFMDRI